MGSMMICFVVLCMACLLWLLWQPAWQVPAWRGCLPFSQLREAASGSLLLCRTATPIGLLQRVFTRSRVTHVGMLLHIAQHPFILHIQHPHGLRLQPFQQLLQESGPPRTWWVRRVQQVLRLPEPALLQEVKALPHYCYAWSFLTVIMHRWLPLLPPVIHCHDRERKRFCSELPIMLLQNLGLLPRTPMSYKYLPVDFEPGGTVDAMLPGLFGSPQQIV